MFIGDRACIRENGGAICAGFLWVEEGFLGLLKICCADNAVIIFNTVANGRQKLFFGSDCLPLDEEC
jgi:hypothetical protein